MKTKTLLFDLDDTLASFREPMYNLLRTLTDKDIHWSQWEKYHVGQSYYGITNEKFCDYIVEHGVLETLKPHDEAKEVLTTLNKNGYDIIIVSARGFHPNAHAVTKEWFDKYELPYEEIVISTHNKSKIDTVDNKNILLSVDDNIGHSEDYLYSNRVNQVLLYDMPWNKDSNIDRVKNLKEIYNYL